MLYSYQKVCWMTKRPGIFGNDLITRLRASQSRAQVVVVAVEGLKFLLVAIDNEVLIVAAEAERVIAADAVFGGIDELHRTVHVV